MQVTFASAKTVLASPSKFMDIQKNKENIIEAK